MSDKQTLIDALLMACADSGCNTCRFHKLALELEGNVKQLTLTQNLQLVQKLLQAVIQRKTLSSKEDIAQV